MKRKLLLKLLSKLLKLLYSLFFSCSITSNNDVQRLIIRKDKIEGSIGIISCDWLIGILNKE